jgi:thiaminase
VNKKYGVLNEDTKMLYNKWVRGIATREMQPEVITVDDIVNRFRNNNSDANPIFPYPLDKMMDFIGDIFVKCADLRRTLAMSVNNPLIKDKAKKIQAVRELNNKIQKMQEQLFSCTEELNKIVEK